AVPHLRDGRRAEGGRRRRVGEVQVISWIVGPRSSGGAGRPGGPMSPSKLIVAALVTGSIGWVTVQASAAEPNAPQASPPSSRTGAHGPAHDASRLIQRQADLAWGPPPDGLPSGARAALLQGNPAEAGGVFAVRVAAPNGYTVKPHFHPT